MEKRSESQEVINKITKANSILLTVGQNPGADDLMALSGLSMGLKQLDKKITNVYSGQIPDKVRFLNPKFDENVNSLCDFVISLDNDKAEKIRVKDEGNASKIYITPKKELTSADLRFDKGEVKTDLVLIIGAKNPNDIDKTLMNDGLDPAKVVFFNLVDSSGYSEMVAELLIGLTDITINSDIANNLLTGIISATDQFGNEKTTAKTFQIAARLLKHGADQQLIVENLRYTPQSSKADSFIQEEPEVIQAEIIEPTYYEPEPDQLPVQSQPEPEFSDVYSGLDLTIPPPPVLTSETAKKKIIPSEKLPHPVDLPPPPVIDFDTMPMPPSADYDQDTARPTNFQQKSDPEQFQIPV